MRRFLLLPRVLLGLALPVVAAATPEPVAGPGAPPPVAQKTTPKAGAVRFFQIGEVTVIKTPPKGKAAVTAFTPHLRVQLVAGDAVPGKTLIAKVHYFDDRRWLIATEPAPIVEEYDDLASAFPAFAPADKAPLTVRFRLPEKVLATPNWTAVIVYGDDKELTAGVFPKGGLLVDYLFDERRRALDPTPAGRERLIVNRVVEYVANTGLSDYPKMTFFLKKPPGVERANQARGVLALCMLANSAADVRRRLEWEDLRDDYLHVLEYAKEHRLLVLAWGCRKVWDGARDTWSMPAEEARDYDRRMEAVAKAWEKGVREFSVRENFKAENMLLWGYSASAQYAHRLALRRPGFFRAVYLHIPSSFDTPRAEAAGLLWCVTTGERDGGYPSSLVFLEKFRALDAMIFHKAVPNLGHGDSRPVHALVRCFFDLALDTPEEEARFRYGHPPAYGDALNQGIVPAAQAEWLPSGQRVPLPDAAWERAWELKPEAPPPVVVVAAAVPVPGAATPPAPPAAPVAVVLDERLFYRAQLSLAANMRQNGLAWPDPPPPAGWHAQSPAVAVAPALPAAPAPVPPDAAPRAVDPDVTVFGRRSPRPVPQEVAR
jgi:hypothetical protein